MSQQFLHLLLGSLMAPDVRAVCLPLPMTEGAMGNLFRRFLK